jgi:uncharacterized GH25 family protein
MYLKKLGLIGLAITLGVILSVSSVYACYPWIVANKYQLKEGATVKFFIPHGRIFPIGKNFYDKPIKALYMIDPEGKKIEVEQKAFGKGKLSQTQFSSKDKLKKGTYLLVSEDKGFFAARTTKGKVRKSKAELKGKEIKGKVTFYQNYCKALVNVGGENGGKAHSKVLGHGLEIVLLKNPNELSVNDFLPFKLLHNGKPLKGVQVYATYMGFPFNNEGVWAYNARVRKEGKGKIRIFQPGTWMIYVNHKFPYPDSKLADEYSFQSTLTFEIRR